MTDEKRIRVTPETPAPVPAREMEKITESPKEKPAVVIEEKPLLAKELPKGPAPALVVPVVPPITAADELTKEIEAVLEEDLAAVYAGLPAELKPQFRAQGEAVARSIRQMMAEAKVKARKVLKLIVNWLRLIPGVNKFFLEQEAAIKTQKIIILAEEERKE